MKSILFIILLVGWVGWGFRWMIGKNRRSGGATGHKGKRKDARSAFTLTDASLSRIPPFPETHGLNPRKEFDNAVILGRWGNFFRREPLQRFLPYHSTTTLTCCPALLVNSR